MPKWEVDQHPEKKQIINALIKGDKSQRNIAKQFGISNAALHRYLHGKLAQQAAKSKTIQDKLTEQAFVEKIDEIETMLREILEEARSEEGKDNNVAIKAIAEIRKGLEFLAKIQGMIKEVTINLTQINQWNDIKTIILKATADAPEVRQRIVNEFAQITGE